MIFKPFKKCVNVHNFNEYADNPPTHAVVEINAKIFNWVNQAITALENCPESYCINRFAYVAKFGQCETEGDPNIDLFTEGSHRIDYSLLNVTNEGKVYLEVGEKHSSDKWETEPFYVSDIIFKSQ